MDPPDTTAGSQPRKLTALMAADVANYSVLIGTDEEGTLSRLRAHLSELIEPAIRKHRGRIFNTAGDSFLAEFGSVVDALRCGVEIQICMAQRNSNVSDPQRIVFRMGIHVGDVVVDGNDIKGDGVNVAARIQDVADPGGICVSEDVVHQVGKNLELSLQTLARGI